MDQRTLLWVIFGTLTAVVLLLDLGVFQRRSHDPSLRESAIWTGVWVALALIFNLVIYFMRGPTAALEFLTGYLVEWSLSMDNVFVFAVLFGFFAVPRQYQHRVLFWGILGAVIMRLTFVLLGAALLHRFHWVIYVFGAIVIIAGLRLLRGHGGVAHPERNPVLRLARRFLRVTPDFVEDRFFVRQNGVLMATPLLLVLLMVEATDVVFAVDSIPAIFAITRDPLIVFTSNIAAVLGLRALYFLLAGVMGIFEHLGRALALVLCFVGVKMLLSEVVEIPILLSLGIILAILAGGVVASLPLANGKASATPDATPAESADGPSGVD